MIDRDTGADAIFTPTRMIACAELVAEQHATNGPEKRLMAAVLKDALHQFQLHVVASDRRGLRLFMEAEEWFASRDAEPLFSFENICTSLGIRASPIRAALFAWRDAQRAGSTAGGAGRESAPHRRRFVRVTPPPVSTGHGRAA